MAANRRLLELELELARRGQANQAPVQTVAPVQTQEAVTPQPEETLGQRLEREPLREINNPLISTEGVRATGIGAGAMVGGVVGAPLGPVGMAVGGALGAAAGEAFASGVEGKTPLETSHRTLKEAKTDLMFTGVASSLRPLFRQLGIARRHILGVGEKEMAEVLEALKFGVELGISEVSRFPAVKTAISVIGRFPFLGTPAKQAAAKKAAQVFQGEERIMARLGPTANLAEVGVDLNAAARTAIKGFRDEAKILYTKARDIADQAGEIIPTKNIKAMARAIAEHFGEARPGRKGIKSPIVEFAESLKDIPDKYTGSQFDALVDDLDVVLKKSQADGFNTKQGLDLKSASEIDLRSVGLDDAGPTLAKAFVKALNEADEFFSRGMKTFETATAQKFNRVTKKAFQVGLKKPGNLNEDELFRVAFNTKSPKAMKDLRALVGSKPFNKAVRAHIDTAFNKSKEVLDEKTAVFNPKKFINALGIGDKNSTTYAAMEESLKSVGINPNDLIRFSKVAERALSTEIPNVSTFLARKATIAGAKGGLSALLPGLAITGGAFGAITPAAAVLMTLGARGAVRMITDPKMLKLATRALDEDVKIGLRRAAAIRIVRLGIREEEKQDKEDPRNAALQINQ